MIDDEQVHEAIDRLARTPDGLMLYRLLQKTVCSISNDLSEGALRRHDGRRSFAADLMGLMAKGISDSERSAAITFSVSGARAVSAAQRGARRRVTADTAVPGWDSPGDAAGSAGSDPA